MAKGKIRGKLVASEYLGSDQFAYIDCGFEQLVTVRVNPNEELKLYHKVGLNFDPLVSHFFDLNGNRI